VGNAMPLTRPERKLQREIHQIARFIDLEYDNIESNYPPRARRGKLEVMKDKMVRTQIIHRYNLIDEFLTDTICDYYFPRKNKNESYRRFWRTKHFRIFVHYLMDEMFLLKKLAMVEAIKTIPPDVAS
jgi:hypothetical protein